MARLLHLTDLHVVAPPARVSGVLETAGLLRDAVDRVLEDLPGKAHFLEGRGHFVGQVGARVRKTLGHLALRRHGNPTRQVGLECALVQVSARGSDDSFSAHFAPLTSCATA